MSQLQNKPENFRILSLDGGGSWSVLQALTLCNLFGEDTPGNKVLANFNLVCANSGGSLVLAALIANFTPGQIVAMFKADKLKNIFSPLSLFEGIPFSKILSFGPKYSAERKHKGLVEILGSHGKTHDNPAHWYMTDIPAKIGLPKLQLVIVNFNYRRNRATFYRSNKHSLADSDYCARLMQHDIDPANNNPPFDYPDYREATLSEIIHGASNAPVNYFNRPALYRVRYDEYDSEFWDGAVGGYNNPVLAGVIEAIVNGTDASKIKILSIGTGNNELEMRKGKAITTEQEKYYVDKAKSTLLNDIPKLSKSILNDPPDAASFHAYCMLNANLFRQNTSFFRFNPLVKPIIDNDLCKPPRGLSVDDFVGLVKLDMDATEDDDIYLIKKLFKSWADDGASNQPIRGNKHKPAVIGHTKFSELRADFFTYF